MVNIKEAAITGLAAGFAWAVGGRIFKAIKDEVMPSDDEDEFEFDD